VAARRPNFANPIKEFSCKPFEGRLLEAEAKLRPEPASLRTLLAYNLLCWLKPLASPRGERGSYPSACASASSRWRRSSAARADASSCASAADYPLLTHFLRALQSIRRLARCARPTTPSPEPSRSAARRSHPQPAGLSPTAPRLAPSARGGRIAITLPVEIRPEHSRHC
jgi:hypothetical protein